MKLIKIISLLLLCATLAHGEGTKEIMPAAANPYYLLFNRTGGLNIPFGLYTPNTGTYHAGTTSADYQLNIRICNVGEVIKFGFNSMSAGTYYRIRRPSDGSIVVGPNLIPTATGPPGYITNYTQAVAGPQSVVGATGYNDISYTALETGDYYIEFNQGNPNTYSTTSFTLRYFDITVTSASNAVITGRIWSEAWQLIDGGSAFNGNFYIYSDDGVVSKVNSNGMTATDFAISANPTGVSNTGNALVDRKSIANDEIYPYYKIFLNDPDNTCFPTGTLGSLLSPVTITGCGTNRCINLQVDKAATVTIFLNINGIAGYQTGTSDVQFTANIVSGDNCVPWDGKDGQGNAIPNGFNVPVQITFQSGLVNLQVFDVENNTNGFKISLSRPTGAVPNLFWDDSGIIPSQYSPATTLDGIINSGGCSLAIGCHRWSNRGNNACPPCSETTNTWWYTGAATVNSSSTIYTSLVDANSTTTGNGYTANNTSACGSITPFSLNGLATGSPGTAGLWTTNGTGVFTPNSTTLNATYTPSAADTVAGSVQLILKTTGGSCPSIKDSMIVSFVKPPSVFAGTNKTACKNNATVTLSDATKVNTTSIAWSGGAGGTFIPATTYLNPTFTPSLAQLAAGSVTLTLTGNGNPLCASSTSTVTITYTPAPVVNPGSDKVVCANNMTANITGNVTPTSTTNWTSSSGCTGCFSSPGSLTTNYTPSVADSTNGSVILKLTANLSGCLPVSDTMTLFIKPAPTSNAGPDKSVCNNGTTVSLSGTNTNATSQSWTSSSGCISCFSNTTTLNTVYTPSAADSIAGTVILKLTSSKLTCNNVADSTIITLVNPPMVYAGYTKFACKNNAAISLSDASVNVSYTSVVWSGGTGSYSPNASTLHPVYTPSATELTAGSMVLTLTGNGSLCSGIKSKVTIFFGPAPTADAGSTQTVCSNNKTATLNGSVSTGAIPSWTSASGCTSCFSSPTSATTNYIPSSADSTNGSVVLTLIANYTGCNPVSSSMTLKVIPAPIVNAGPDLSICSNNAIATINGTVSNASSQVWSSSSGCSSCFSSTASPNSVYTGSSADVASGSVVLKLTASQAHCNDVKDSAVITFTSAPIVTAGPLGAFFCHDNPAVQLSGSSSTSSGKWSGAGTFVPNNTTLNAQYIPTAAEVSSGSASLTLTSTNNGNCNAVPATLIATEAPQPIVSAGSDQTTCQINPTISLTGTISGTYSGSPSWSSTSSGSFSNPNSLTTTYTLTASDIANGKAVLSLSVNNANVSCTVPIEASMQVIISPTPAASAGADQILCGSSVTVNLNATSSTNAGIWSGGTGTFVNNTNLNARYNPTASDKASGSVTLTFTNTLTGACSPASDQVVLTFTPVPSANAGPDQANLCVVPGTANLAASGSPGTWSGGAGTYSPNNATLNANYQATSSELSSGSVTLIYTTTPSGACSPVSDRVVLTFQPLPTANAGPDQPNLCVVPGTAKLNGTGTAGTWSGGAGTYSPNNAALYATYHATSAELASGSVTLTYLSTLSSACPAASDQVVLTFLPSPTAVAGPDQTLGAVNQSVSFDGTGSTTGSFITYQWSSQSNAVDFNNAALLAPKGTVHQLPATVYLKVQDSGNGCSDTDTLEIREIDVEIPNAFSPNKDGTNDFFRIKNIEKYPEASIEIFDQWNTLIFKGEPAATALWEGNYNGKSCPAATYYYVLDLKEEGKRKIKGYITLLR